MEENLLNKRENETDFQYIKRLTLNKREYDIDYSEWGNKILGVDNNYSSENLRKAFYVLEKLFTKIDDTQVNNISDDDIAKEIELQKQELYKERKKIQTTKLEYNRLLREDARKEMLIEEIKSAIETVEVPKFNPIVEEENCEKIGVLGFADVHFGKIFQSLTNSYSEDIAYQRMNKLIEETLKICKEQNINKLIVINCADSIEGMCLRISQLQNLSIGIVDMTIRFAKFMVEWLNKLSEYVYVDYYHVNQSNHSQIRPFGTMANQFQDEDMERIIITYIHDMLQNNNRINVHMFDKDFVEFNVFNFDIISQHGHKIKNIKNAIRDLSILHRKFYSYAYFAHLHHSESIVVAEGETNNCEVLLIPSVMGADDYSDDLLTGSKAGARLDIFTEKEGRKITYNIILN